MKRNVDLTANEMFAPVRTSGIVRIAQLERQLGAATSVFRISNRVELYDEITLFHPVLTGNRDTRDNKRFYQSMDTGDTCDCCGISLISFPWNRRYGLCKRCEKELDQTSGKKSQPFNIDQGMQEDRRKVRIIL